MIELSRNSRTVVIRFYSSFRDLEIPLPLPACAHELHYFRIRVRVLLYFPPHIYCSISWMKAVMGDDLARSYFSQAYNAETHGWLLHVQLTRRLLVDTGLLLNCQHPCFIIIIRRRRRSSFQLFILWPDT